MTLWTVYAPFSWTARSKAGIIRVSLTATGDIADLRTAVLKTVIEDGVGKLGEGNCAYIENLERCLRRNNWWLGGKSNRALIPTVDLSLRLSRVEVMLLFGATHFRSEGLRPN